MALINAIWSQVKESIRREITDTPYTMWFAEAEAVNLTNGSVTVIAGDEFIKNVLISRYHTLISGYFKDILGYDIKINYTSKEATSLEDESIFNQFEPSDAHIAEPEIEVSAEPENMVTGSYTFENFVVGDSNKIAQRSCYAVANDPAIKINPLFLYGPPGLGKTHLLFAIMNEVKRRNPKFNALYVTGEQFTNEIIEAIIPQELKTVAFREKYRKVDMLLVDDIQFIAGKNKVQEEFFHTFDALYKMEKQIILTSDKSPREIKLLEERLCSRFVSGLITDIQPPDVETRVAIIRQKIGSYKIDLSNDVLTYLADNIKNNVRQIEGAIKKLWAHSFITSEEINLDMAKTVLADYIKDNSRRIVTSQMIFDFIIKRFGIPADDLTGKKRNAEIVYVRHIAIYLTNELTNLTLKQIGHIFGKDHSTIMNARDSVIKRMKIDSAFNKEIKEILTEIRNED